MMVTDEGDSTGIDLEYFFEDLSGEDSTRIAGAILIIIGMSIFAKDKMNMLTSNISGQVLLFTVVILEAIGIYFTYKTLQLDI